MNNTQTFSIDGIDIHVEGPADPLASTLLLVHGWPDSWRLWDGFVEQAASRHRCVRFTLPGFERRRPIRAHSLDEMVDFIARVVDASSPGKPVILVLHDWGCLFGYEYAMRHPRRVERIIGIDIGDAASVDYLRSLGVREKLMIAAYQLWLAAAWLLPGSIGDRMTRAMARALRCPAPAESIGAFMNFPYFIQWSGRHGSYRRLTQFRPQVPYLYIYGRRKPFMFHSGAWLELVGGQPGNRVAALKAGHWVMCDAPAEFNQTVLSWLESNEGL